MVRQIQGVDSEVGQLRTVLMHRPGLELQRITHRHKDRLLFGTLPWVSKARQEHDVLSQELRDQGVEVLYFTELLQDSLEYQPARDEAIGMAIADAGLGDELRGQLRAHLEDLGPEQLAQVLIAGLTPEELKIGHGVVFELLDRHDFVLDPLPNLVFTKDSSFWIGDQVAVASLTAERRRRETDLAGVIYRHHPRFAGTKSLYRPDLEHVDGGDVLLLAPGVVAIGVGHSTTPAGTERLARRLFDRGLAHSVLAVPMRQYCGASHLDTVCAVVDTDAVVMHPAVAYALTAHTISPRPQGMRVSRARPFLEAAAEAMGIERLRVIDTGTEPAWGQPGQRDDGGNVLAVGRGLAVSHERNSESNARLEAAGVRVIRVPSSELGSVRGGPRCMTCPVGREPAALPDIGPQAVSPAEPVREPSLRTDLAEISVPDFRRSSQPGAVPVGVTASTGLARTPGTGSYPRDGSHDTAGQDRPEPAEKDHSARGDRDRAELASASLAATPRSAGRAPGAPEGAEGHPDDHDDQRDQGQPEQRVNDGCGHQHDEEHNDEPGDDVQQDAHAYTVRRSCKVLVIRPQCCAPASRCRLGAAGSALRRTVDLAR
jgi:arginine deiminase